MLALQSRWSFDSNEQFPRFRSRKRQTSVRACSYKTEYEIPAAENPEQSKLNLRHWLSVEPVFTLILFSFKISEFMAVLKLPVLHKCMSSIIRDKKFPNFIKSKYP